MLLCLGDSFTSGYGLDPGTLAWPYAAGSTLGVSTVVIAKPGASNDWIFRQALTATLTHVTHVIIAWSILSRIEYADKHGEHTLGIPNQRCFPHLKTLNNAALQSCDTWRKEQFCALTRAVDSYFSSHSIPVLQTMITPQPTKWCSVPSAVYAQPGTTLTEIVYSRFADAGNLPCGHPGQPAHQHIGETLGKHLRDICRLP